MCHYCENCDQCNADYICQECVLIIVGVYLIVQLINDDTVDIEYKSLINNGRQIRRNRESKCIRSRQL